jgi:hypothetical protein
VGESLPYLTALVFGLLSVLLLRKASGADWTLIHIGSICGIAFQSGGARLVMITKANLYYLPGFPDSLLAAAIVPILCLSRWT